MINVSAKQTMLRIGPKAGEERYVMQAQMYSTLDESKMIKEAALRTGLPKHIISASWSVCAELLATWATEGHSVPIPGLGHMRFGIRSTAVEDVKDVKTDLITSRRVIFIPSVEIKDALAKTSINITCFDRDGNKIKTVTSTDTNDIEDNDDNGAGIDNGNGTGSGTGSTDSGSGSSGTGSDSDLPSGDDDMPNP